MSRRAAASVAAEDVDVGWMVLVLVLGARCKRRPSADIE